MLKVAPAIGVDVDTVKSWIRVLDLLEKIYQQRAALAQIFTLAQLLGVPP